MVDALDKTADARRVLVVDDNTHIHDDFRKILAAEVEPDAELATLATRLFGDAGTTNRRGAFDVDSASQGREGLKCVTAAMSESRPYSIAFIDMRMPPGWNGVETAAEVWKADPDIQLVICTAYSDFSWAEVVATLGETDKLHLLRKPFQPIQVRKLATVLAQKWARLAKQRR